MGLAGLEDMTYAQARDLLTEWGEQQRRLDGARDLYVRASASAGLSRAEIRRLTGLARTTIDRILSEKKEAGE